MSEYISKFSGPEIDEALQKSKDITKTAGEVNTALSNVDLIKGGIDSAKDGEVLSKKADGSLEGTGIINETDKIFFPKDGRFPSGSVDIGPAITISENGGWVQNHTNTLGKDYIFLDYEVDKTGTKRPSYSERGAEQLNVIINSANSTTMQNVTTFMHNPSTSSQINALYFNFATPVTNLRAEIVSMVTGSPIKYMPNENAWKKGVGGLNVLSGVHNVLNTEKQTPFSTQPTYQLRINVIADQPINLMGDGIKPYMSADLQVITEKGVLLLGEGTGSPDTGEQIRDKLILLTGENKLSVNDLKDVPEGLIAETAQSIRNKLQTLVSDNRLSHTAIKDLVLFDSILNAKLSGIEYGAEVNHTAAEIKTLYESNANTNAFTDGEKNKLNSLTGGRFLGVYATLTDLQVAHPTGTTGDAATVTEPSSNLFYWNGTTWADSGTGFIGDMIKSVYDPTNKHTDVYSMDNMDETATKKIFTAVERLKLDGIAEGAEINVQANWNESSPLSDEFIKNKPTVYNAVGGGYFSGQVDTTATLLGIAYKINADFTPWSFLKDFTWDSINKRFVYSGLGTDAQLNLCLSSKSNTNNVLFSFLITKNGTEILGSRSGSDFSASGKLQRICICVQTQLSLNDFIEIKVISNTNNVVVSTLDAQLVVR